MTLGKPLDVRSLKQAGLGEIQAEIETCASLAARLYQSDRACHRIDNCPCCSAGLEDAVEGARIFDVPYRRCARCGHAFVDPQPDTGSLAEIYASEEQSATYTDRASLEPRLRQVMQPKLEWVLSAYQSNRSRPARNVIDVGAAGGQFLEVCRRAGLECDGYEVSPPSREFARRTFGIELRADDYLATEGRIGTPDIITMWGLLEYTPQPRAFLERARGQLDPASGMLIVEVPRYECISTAIQQEYPTSAARHLVPSSHMNIFTDASLASALLDCGFAVVSAWYFGMDVYELLIQLGLHGSANALDRFGHLIPGLQHHLDLALLCDDLVVAAVPVSDE